MQSKYPREDKNNARQILSASFISNRTTSLDIGAYTGRSVSLVISLVIFLVIGRYNRC